MRNMMRYQLGFTVFILMLGLCVPVYAYRAVQLDQAKVRVAIAPGSTKSGRIEVYNPYEKAQFVKVMIEDWIYTSSNGEKKFFPAGSTKMSCAPWITFAPAEFTVPPKGKQYVNYVVRMPSDAHAGAYAALFFEGDTSPAPTTQEGMASVGLKVRIGALFYIDPVGYGKRSAGFSNLVFTPGEGGGISFKADVVNTGNLDIIAAGNFNVIDDKGVVYSRGEFKNKVFLLPGDKGESQGVIKEALRPGVYDIILTFDLGNSWDMTRGPIVVKEARIEIGSDGSITNSGELR